MLLKILQEYLNTQTYDSATEQSQDRMRGGHHRSNYDKRWDGLSHLHDH